MVDKEWFSAESGIIIFQGQIHDRNWHESAETTKEEWCIVSRTMNRLQCLETTTSPIVDKDCSKINSIKKRRVGSKPIDA